MGEQHHESVAQKTFQRAFVFENEFAKLRMVIAQHGHHLFWLGGLGERGKAAQVPEDDGDIASMTVEQTLVAFTENEFGDLRRKKALEPAGPLDL